MYDYTYIHTYIPSDENLTDCTIVKLHYCVKVESGQKENLSGVFLSYCHLSFIYIYVFNLGEEEVMVTEETFPMWKGLARLISHKSCACISKKSTTFA